MGVGNNFGMMRGIIITENQLKIVINLHAEVTSHCMNWRTGSEVRYKWYNPLHIIKSLSSPNSPFWKRRKNSMVE
jgi:hypothetical protein